MTARRNEAKIIKVEGVVQRVGFRRFAEKSARSSRVTGYVQNMNDGTVQIFAQGKGEDLDLFVEKIRKAKEPIIIDNVVIKGAAPRSKIKNFAIKSGPLALEMQEGFGAIETQFSDYRGQFNSYLGEFKDYRRQFNGYVDEFHGYVALRLQL